MADQQDPPPEDVNPALPALNTLPLPGKFDSVDNLKQSPPVAEMGQPIWTLPQGYMAKHNENK